MFLFMYNIREQIITGFLQDNKNMLFAVPFVLPLLLHIQSCMYVIN